MKQKTLAVTISLLLPSLSVAQTADDITTLDEVLVESAYAVSATADNIASSLTVLNESDFQQRDATYVSDILKTVPGIAVGSSGGHGAQTSVFLRGADSDQTLLIVDGIKMNPATGGSVDFGSLSLANVERIEILRGEQSALWGSDAVGGVIYITTKSGKNADKPFHADVNLGGGTNDSVDAAANIYGYQDGLYYALAVANNRSHGISALSKKTFNYQATDGTAITTGGAAEDDKFQRASGSARVGYEFDNAGVELFASHTTQTVHFDENLTNEASSDPHSKSNENSVKFSGYIGSSDDLLKHSAFISNVNNHSETKGKHPSQNVGEKRNVGYQLDINFDREGATTQSVTTLLEYQKNTLDTANFSDTKAITQKSIALEYRLFNEDDHALAVGVRHDDNNEFDNASTYRLAGGYRLNDNLRLHGSFGTAVKNPTMYDYYGYYGTYAANPDLKPEKSRGGDFGIALQSQDETQHLDITYFTRRVEDLITANATWDGSINIDGKSNMRGIEAAYRGNFNEKLSAYANYTYTQAEDSKGKQLLRRPKHQAGIGVNYRFNEALSANANALYVGKRMDNHYDSTTWTSHLVEMPDYTLFNLGANYQINKQFATYFNVNNVFDKAYENVIGYGQAGRTFYLGIKGNF